MLDVDKIKAANNIEDVISSCIPIKKEGKNHFGLCPFHSEKSPSFTVVPSKQFYYCFGCGAQGDVIRFVMEYQGVEFKDACKILGAEIENKPAKEVEKIIERNKNRVTYSTPIDHKQDPERAKACILGLSPDGWWRVKGETESRYMVMKTYDGMTLNVAKYPEKEYLAGGVSYGAFTLLTGKGIPIVCECPFDGIKLRESTGRPVYIAHTHENIKYVADIAKPESIQVQVALNEPDEIYQEDYDCFMIGDFYEKL